MGLKRKLLSNYKAKLDREYYHSNKAKRRNRIVNELANNITSLTQNIHDEPNGNVIISIPNSIPKEYQIKSTTFGQIKEKFFPKPHNSKGTNIQDNKRVMFDDRNDYGKYHTSS